MSSAAIAIDLLVAMIRNACVNDGTPESGHEDRSADTVAEFLGDPGRRFEPVPGRVSSIYRVPGRDRSAPTLMFMGHLDVVPVNEAGWTVDPFEGLRRDGFVWGRGAVDMLNQTAAMVAAFADYWNGDAEPPGGDLVLAIVADEEAGAVHGVEYILNADPEALSCDYLITEIGLAPLPAAGGGRGLPVTVAEKGPLWTRLRTAGVPGHASQPYAARSALAPAAEAAHHLATSPTPVAITSEWEAFVEAVDWPQERREAFLDPELLDAAIDDLAMTDPGLAKWVHACTHLTVVPTLMSAGTKANVIADSAEVDVDVRALPGQDQADLDDHFRKALGPSLLEDIEVEPLLSFPATASAAQGPLWDALAAAYAAGGGDGGLIPSMIPVSTDARFFRQAGVVAYGAAHFDDAMSFGEVLSLYHGNDERVSEGSVAATFELFARTITEFAARS
ncbi:MAG: M20/M25/M40 family metallo-hydrolase [Acidimicrobiia bacterium]|nr:M20/M25/M40 family metallo-hydrolase [Acidimicrobiia bacterium]